MKAAELGEKHGYTVRLGDLFRDPRAHGKFGVKKGYGHKNSCHKLKLAQDINIIKPNGELDAKGKFHKELGEWWEKQHRYCRWGGRFNDGNHYSLTHWGAM